MRKAAFVVAAALATVAVFRGTSTSEPVAVAAVLAVGTAAAIHARLSMGGWTSVATLLLAGAALAALGAPLRLIASALAGGVVASALVSRRAGRSAVLHAAGWSGLAAGLVHLSGVAAVVSLPVDATYREAAGALAGAILSAPLVLTLGPSAESLFGYTSRLTMTEWLGFDHPLLRELAAAAPGTFQHSVNVGVLSDAAARAINGDALLARVGGLYHDVGKTRAPHYFVENQRDGNPHDQLDPWESARILRAHVSDGVDLVSAHGMGDQIADFVREHHGTGTMKSFLEKAGASPGRGPAGETYRYPGPRPRSRETAVVMMADQVEATGRAERPADDAACEQIVRRTIDRIRNEGELEDAGLSPGELTAIGSALARTLAAMHHNRTTLPPVGSPPRIRRFRLVPRAMLRG